ncbi:Cysteine-rich receptor-like protein kinase 10 [Linum grandiflorum]
MFFLLLSWNSYLSQHVQGATVLCLNERNYTSGNPFQLNLNLTLASLSANAYLHGYFTTSVGQSPDIVYGLVQCTGYTARDECRAIAIYMATRILQLCPNQKQGSIYADGCSLQYSDWNFFSTMDSDPIDYQWNTKNPTDDFALLGSKLEKLLKSLSPSAAVSPSRIYSGMTPFVEGRNIYAMVQCSKGISGSDCLTCLENISESYMKFFKQEQQSEGGGLLAPSCNMRFETYQFFSVLSPATALVPSGGNHSEDRGSSLVPSDSEGTGKTSKTMIMLVMAAAFASILIITVGDSNRHLESLLIELNELREATNNFSEKNKLGQGGFGPVYKGKMLNGKYIAVKRLSTSSKQGLEELQTEVMLVAKLRHQNLVRLVGFCIEEDEKLLVYEYLPNGSLDKFLFDQKRRLKLNWEMRYNIIVGIARGLLYLHEEYPLKIVHRDMKASNILLNESLTPKISDFGLARLFPGTQNHCFTNRIVGTYGYMAPEYAVRGHYSTKSDVYSFGILILEIITGRKNSSFQNSRNLQSYAWKHWIDGTALKILDPSLGEDFKKDEVLKCINIGLLSVQEVAEKRPKMSDVVLKLGSYTKLCPPPLLTGISNTKNTTPDSSNEDSDVNGSNIDDIA